ncbi:hypothetical protein ACE6H2_019231 [Prunus campanulata]
MATELALGHGCSCGHAATCIGNFLNLFLFFFGRNLVLLVSRNISAVKYLY